MEHACFTHLLQQRYNIVARNLDFVYVVPCILSLNRRGRSSPGMVRPNIKQLPFREKKLLARALDSSFFFQANQWFRHGYSDLVQHTHTYIHTRTASSRTPHIHTMCMYTHSMRRTTAVPRAVRKKDRQMDGAENVGSAMTRPGPPPLN